MPFNGSGVFLRLMNWTNDAASNIKIRADRHDVEDNNLAQGLTNCITRDGQSAITANLPMSGYRFTNVGDAQASNEYATLGQVTNTVFDAGTIAGSVNVYTMALSNPPTAYAAGQVFWGKINITNTGAATLNVAGLGAKSIKSFGTVDVIANELSSNKAYAFYYDGTNFLSIPNTQFGDDAFRILGSVDATKKLAFEIDGFTTATTRTITVPNVSGTMYVSGGTDVAIADGGTGASTVAAAQLNLGIYQNSQAFTASGTFTPAAGVTRVYVEVWGAGGGGGGANAVNGYAGAGGGGGGYSAGFVNVTPSVAQTVTVGTGGGGGNNTGAVGSNGGTSSFAGALTITATGGLGGSGNPAGANQSAGGAGGTGSIGTTNITGQTGQNGSYTGGSFTGSGAGGSSPRGSDGAYGITGSSTFPIAGNNGVGVGAGGSGAIGGAGGAAGGNGSNGLVIVYYP